MTLDELIQALNNSSADAREVLSKLRELLLVNGDVNFNLADGTVITAPSLPKLRQQYWDNMDSVMDRIYYVDAVNGNDSNDGSESAPFASLKKAIDSVPVGGKGLINLISDYTINNNIQIVNKDITIKVSSGKILKPSWAQDSSNDFNWLNVFNLIGRVILGISLEDGAKVVLDDTGYSTTVNIGDSSYTQFIKKASRCIGLVYVNGSSTTIKPIIELNGVNSSPVFMSAGSDHSLEFLVLKLWEVDVVVNGQGKLITAYPGAVMFFPSQASLIDNTGTISSWADLIGGIVKDGNGVPRNVLSNVIF
ncbi:MAG TPA: hypothetical protein ENJ40_05675 [Thermosulfurimonas dismutans]|uniref:Uncharacterized protein n=1 Tax=Thermosulfurimonas dismutans TaxID=999894 RepID=A0A7C3CPW3_9BACT|nr:hypothetical protein [Thermosulfurimonas dismutans]